MVKEHGKVGDLLTCYVKLCYEAFWYGCFFFFFLFFLADLHILSDIVLNISNSHATKMILGDPSEFSMSLA